MEPIEYTVIPYKKENGRTPTMEALSDFEKVSPELRDAVLAGIEKLGDSSTHSSTLIKKAESGLWYLRIQKNRNCARLFFIFTKKAEIYLLSGFVKKDNKIPVNELKRARLIAKEARLCLAMN